MDGWVWGIAWMDLQVGREVGRFVGGWVCEEVDGWIYRWVGR